jgi:hypothetical protein
LSGTPPQPRAGRKALYRVAALLLSAALACAIGEAALRLLGYSRSYINPIGSFHFRDAVTGCRGKPNFSGRFRRSDFDVLVVHDENGFRRGEEHPELPPPERDVYVLGDSFVWGFGVGQNDVLTDRMATLLPGRRVHNLGLIGAGTVEEYTLFQQYAHDRLRPGDVVVVAFYGNDFGDNVGRYTTNRLHAAVQDGEIRPVYPEPPPPFSQLKSGLKDASCLFNLLTYCLDRYRQSGTEGKMPDRASRSGPLPEALRAAADDGSPEVAVTRFFLGEFQRACGEKKALLLVAYIPGQAELGEDEAGATEDLSPPEQQLFRQAFQRCTRALGIRTIDLLPPMLAAKRSGRFDRLTFRHDFHWAPSGHTVAAETIARSILETK